MGCGDENAGDDRIRRGRWAVKDVVLSWVFLGGEPFSRQ